MKSPKSIKGNYILEGLTKEEGDRNVRGKKNNRSRGETTLVSNQTESEGREQLLVTGPKKRKRRQMGPEGRKKRTKGPSWKTDCRS